MTQTLPARVQIDLADFALTGGWGFAARTADLTARLMARPEDMRGTSDNIAFMVNEILENAVKFRAKDSGPVSVTVWGENNSVFLTVSNGATAESAEALDRLRQEIATHDAGDLLIARIEANAALNRDVGSGLGLLTLLNDYGATIDWDIDLSGPNGTAKVATHVCLPLT